jgi:hypothetical protein
LKIQQGRCLECGLFFRDGDDLAVSCSLLHRHCLKNIEAECSPPPGSV